MLDTVSSGSISPSRCVPLGRATRKIALKYLMYRIHHVPSKMVYIGGSALHQAEAQTIQLPLSR